MLTNPIKRLVIYIKNQETEETAIARIWNKRKLKEHSRSSRTCGWKGCQISAQNVDYPSASTNAAWPRVPPAVCFLQKPLNVFTPPHPIPSLTPSNLLGFLHTNPNLPRFSISSCHGFSYKGFKALKFPPQCILSSLPSQNLHVDQTFAPDISQGGTWFWFCSVKCLETGICYGGKGLSSWSQPRHK